MGILNVTPDSFSDGGRFLDATAAYERAMRLLDDGADIVDLGAESTRPGAAPVEVDEELVSGVILERLDARQHCWCRRLRCELLSKSCRAAGLLSLPNWSRSDERW